MAQTSALIALVKPVLHRVLCSNETLPNAPKHYETHTNLSLGSNGVVGCVRCEKLWCDFMARTSALIALVQPVLHRGSCSNETLPNAPIYYETHQNMSLGSNGVDQVRSLRKILMRLHGTNFCINCTSSTRFAPTFVYWQNIAKCTQILRDTPKHEFRVQWGGLGATSWHKLVH